MAVHNNTYSRTHPLIIMLAREQHNVLLSLKYSTRSLSPLPGFHVSAVVYELLLPLRSPFKQLTRREIVPVDDIIRQTKNLFCVII